MLEWVQFSIKIENFNSYNKINNLRNDPIEIIITINWLS